VDESLTSHIENLAFNCFKQRSSFGDSPSATNANIIAALYAEVIGVLAQTRFQSVRKRFLAEFKENAGNSEMLVNVICGMKYLRIKVRLSIKIFPSALHHFFSKDFFVVVIFAVRCR
jgi:hypothetical protein